VSDELIVRLAEANARMAEALAAVCGPPTVLQAERIHTPQQPHEIPALTFDALSPDEWDKPERLWKREEEEDAEHLRAVTGIADPHDDVDPEFLKEVLEHAGLDPNIS
jgi:hypothetical protein